MGNILKVTAAWSGFTGSPGYSNFYFREANPGASWDQGAFAAADKVHTFFNELKHIFPPNVAWKINTDVPVIDENNGEMQEVANAGPRNTLQATGPAQSYSAASGAVVTWRTSGVRRGRRVRGRTFLVPAGYSTLQTDGTLLPDAIANLQAAANGLIASDGARNLVVWTRPSHKGATDGLAHTVLTASVPDKVAILKSRRD
jgi:outer membrane receptor for ferric coprogen and ferric-rhodotorulic acid